MRIAVFASISMCLCSLLYSMEHEKKFSRQVNGMPKMLLEQCNETTIRQVLNHELVNFPIKSCSILTGGWDNTVVEVNEEWIFRFPRQESMAAIIARELKLLERLHGFVTMPIPRYEFVGTNVAMVGYRKLQGQELLGRHYCILSADAKQAIAQSLALFMKQMHTALSVTEARELGYTYYNPPLDEIETKLLGTLPIPALEKLVSDAIASARKQKHDPARLTLIHNDLHGENMAYNPTRQSVVGIFDFSDAVIADFAIEFSKLFLIDSDLTKRTADAYSQLTGAKNILGIAATDHIIRRATYLLEFRQEGNNSKEQEMIDMLTNFLPVWMKIKRLKK